MSGEELGEKAEEIMGWHPKNVAVWREGSIRRRIQDRLCAERQGRERDLRYNCMCVVGLRVGILEQYSRESRSLELNLKAGKLISDKEQGHFIVRDREQRGRLVITRKGILSDGKED